MNYEFQYPQAFWLLALIPVFLLLYLGYLLWKRKRRKKIGDQRLVAVITSAYSPAKSWIKFSLLMLAFALGCIAVANPRKPDMNLAESRKGIDVVIALDISRSMLAKDVEPSRLELAKQFINKLSDRLIDDRIALVFFAGDGYVRTPLTFDRSATRLFVSIADPDAVKVPGTNIDSAFKKSLTVFGDDEDRFKSIVLITDGESHAVSSDEVLKSITTKGIMVNTVGIGSPEGTTLLDSAGKVKEDEGQVVVSKLNESLLEDLAKQTNGVYTHLQNVDSGVETVTGQLASIEKKALKDLSTFNFKPFYAWLAVPMLLLLVMEVFFPDRKKKNIMKTILYCLIFLLPTGASAQLETIYKGNTYYLQSQYSMAENLYRKALEREPGNTTVQFNLANALQKQKKYAEAIIITQKLTGSAPTKEMRSSSWYNLGVAHTKQKNLQLSIDAYKQALRLNPEDRDARQNLQKALSELKQQQQQNKPEPKMDNGSADQKLKLLQQRERELLRRLQSKEKEENAPSKDW